MKLCMLRGLPASGKSTYAKELVKQGWKRVNKDDLRAMLDDGKWSQHNESIVKDVEKNLVFRFLRDGFNVVVDDTNFAYETLWKTVADTCGAEFEVKHFDTSPSECVERDAKRGDKSVGPKVIWQMYRQYCAPKKVPRVHTLPTAFMFDIDGTLALMGKRSPYDWDKVDLDELNEDVADTLACLSMAGHKIIIMSGRDSVCRDKTEAWLKKHNIRYDALYMRPEGDMRKDSIIKRELYNNHVKGFYNVLGVFDDRNQVVELWRSLGLTCFQVAEGNF